MDGPSWSDCTTEQRLAAARAALPDDYAIVPREPTAEAIATIAAGSTMPGIRLLIQGIYRAMIDAHDRH